MDFVFKMVIVMQKSRAAAAVEAAQAKADAKNQEAVMILAVDAASRLTETETGSADSMARALTEATEAAARASEAQEAHAQVLEESRLVQERLKGDQEEVNETLRLERLTREALKTGAMSILCSRVLADAAHFV